MQLTNSPEQPLEVSQCPKGPVPVLATVPMSWEDSVCPRQGLGSELDTFGHQASCAWEVSQREGSGWLLMVAAGGWPQVTREAGVRGRVSDECTSGQTGQLL